MPLAVVCVVAMPGELRELAGGMYVPVYFCRLKVASNRELQRRFADQPNLLPNCCNSNLGRAGPARRAATHHPVGSGRPAVELVRVRVHRKNS